MHKLWVFSILVELSVVVFCYSDYQKTYLSVFKKISEQFSGDADVCFINDGFSLLHEKLMVIESIRYILKINDDDSVANIPFCSSIILSTKTWNTSRVHQFIEKNINMTKTKVLLVVENSSSFDFEDLSSISWERNLNILTLDYLYEPLSIMEHKDEENDANLTIYSVMLNQQLISCSTIDSECFRSFNFSLVDDPWSPEQMLVKLNRTFKVSASAHPPYFERFEGAFKGIDFELVKLMIQTWPITYRIFPERHESNKGVHYETLVEFLNSANDGDMSVGGLWLTNDFPSTHPYAKQCNTFLIHRPSLLPDTTFVFQYFQATLWLSYFCILVFMSFLLRLCYSLYHVDYSFDYCLLMIVHFVANMGIPRFPDKNKFYVRYILIIWMMFCLLMTTYFCVGLTVTLRFPRFTQAINNWHDMVDLDIKWIENSKFYRDRISGWGIHDQYLKKLSSLFEYEEDIEVINDKLRENYAVRVQKLPGFYLTNTGWMSEYAKKNFKWLKDCFLVWYNAFLLKNPTPFLEYFNRKTLEMVEYGFVSYWYRHHTNKKKNRYMMMFFNEYSDEFIQFMKFDKLKSCFLLLSCGLFLSVIIFVLEKLNFSSMIEVSQH